MDSYLALGFTAAPGGVAPTVPLQARSWPSLLAHASVCLMRACSFSARRAAISWMALATSGLGSSARSVGARASVAARVAISVLFMESPINGSELSNNYNAQKVWMGGKNEENGTPH